MTMKEWDEKYDNKNSLRFLFSSKIPNKNTISYDSIPGRGRKISRETGSQF